jgi:acyl-CoA synthetase (AMP-forming)/AMP-acid ligase II
LGYWPGFLVIIAAKDNLPWQEEQTFQNWKSWGATMDELFALLSDFKNHGERTAICLGEEEISFSRLACAVDGLADYLVREGFGPSRPLATLLPNGFDQIVTHLGALMSGVPLIRLNVAFAPAQIAHCLKTFAPFGLVATSDQLKALRLEYSLNDIRVLLSGSLEGLSRPGPGTILRGHPAAVALATLATEPGQVATVTFTSGTTARPKGVIHSRRAVLHAIRRSARLMRFSQKDVVFVRLALYGQLGMIVQCLPALVAGATVELALGGPVEVYQRALSTGREKTVVVDGPSIIAEVLRHPESQGFRFDSLRRVVVGGDFVPPRFQAKAGHLLGDRFSVAYGMTEVGMISILDQDSRETNCGLVGFPLEDTEIRVVDDGGNDLPAGQMGDILVRTPSSFEGYWGQPDLTRSVLLPDGWVATGDIGQLETSGMLRLLGRRKEMLVYQGWKIAPVEVETVLQAHPGVQQAAIAGVGDSPENQRMEAFIVVREHFYPSPSREDLHELAAARLARYMVPEEIHFVRRLPHFPSGKLDRERLSMISLAGLWEELNE